jgi:hypothetical protein
MAIEFQLHALHAYYVRASAIFEDFKRLRDQEKERNDAPDLLSAFEMLSRLSVFYGLLFAVIEGFQELQISDAKLDTLLAHPNLDVLRRYRNAIFHFQADFYESMKVLEMLENDTSVAWIRSVWKELNRWFSDNLVHTTLGRPT